MRGSVLEDYSLVNHLCLHRILAAHLQWAERMIMKKRANIYTFPKLKVMLPNNECKREKKERHELNNNNKKKNINQRYS